MENEGLTKEKLITILGSITDNLVKVNENDKPIKVIVNGSEVNSKQLRQIRKELETGPSYELIVKGSYIKEG